MVRFRGPRGRCCSPAGFNSSTSLDFNNTHTCYFEANAFDAGGTAKGTEGAVEEDRGAPADCAEECAIEELSETQGREVWVGCRE